MSFLALIFAHLLADYPLQGDFIANMKGKNWLVLLTHASIWTGCIAICGYLLGYNVYYDDIIILLSVHFIADYLKATNRLWYKSMDSLKGGLLTDQLIHIGQILLFMYTNNR